MKTILIMRHGKAEAHDAAHDHERVLAARGRREATAAGFWLKENGMMPDYVISSDAARAQETAQLAIQSADYQGELTLESAIYEASLADLLEVIYALPNTAARVLMVGHNPGFEDLVHALADTSLKVGSLPTASIAVLQFDADSWADIGLHLGKPVGYFTPKVAD